MFGVVTVKRTSVCVPGVMFPSSTLQNVAGRSSTRVNHCWPKLELTMRSGSPFRSGVLFLLSPAKKGTATARASKRIDRRFIQSPSKSGCMGEGGTARNVDLRPYGNVFRFESQLLGASVQKTRRARTRSSDPQMNAGEGALRARAQKLLRMPAT